MWYWSSPQSISAGMWKLKLEKPVLPAPQSCVRTLGWQALVTLSFKGDAVVFGLPSAGCSAGPCCLSWLANREEWCYPNSFSAHNTSLLAIVFAHFISAPQSLKQIMWARKILCSVKYYNLLVVSASHLEEEAKINPSTILSDVLIWKLKANANCREEVTWRYQMITSYLSWLPFQLLRIYKERG